MDGPARWAVFAVFALGVLLRLPAFARPLLSDDEAIYATTADAMMRGDLLYRDVVDHKPPLIYHVYQAGFAVLGRYQTQGAHALVLVAVLVTALFLRAAARGGREAEGEGLAAAALFLIFSTTWHDYDALAANCELFLLAPQAAAAWLVLRAPARGARALGAHLAIGALVGTSALFKYQGLTFLGASGGCCCGRCGAAGCPGAGPSPASSVSWSARRCRRRCTCSAASPPVTRRPPSTGSASTSRMWAPG